jgi:hypothetical protein
MTLKSLAVEKADAEATLNTMKLIEIEKEIMRLSNEQKAL